MVRRLRKLVLPGFHDPQAGLYLVPPASQPATIATIRFLFVPAADLASWSTTCLLRDAACLHCTLCTRPLKGKAFASKASGIDRPSRKSQGRQAVVNRPNHRCPCPWLSRDATQHSCGVVRECEPGVFNLNRPWQRSVRGEGFNTPGEVVMTDSI